MKVLITGMTSRTANPAASFRDVTFAHLIAEALRGAGHEVEHRNPYLAEDVTGFDMVVVGMAPLHGLGSNRTYGALSAIMRTWTTGKLVLMCDDSDTGKIFSGLRTMVDNPARLTKPFFAYKLEHAEASQDPWKSWLEEGVKLLRDAPWPTTIAPITTGMDAPRIGPGNVPNVVGIDPTALLDTNLLKDLAVPGDAGRIDRWLLEGNESRWVNKIAHELTRPIFKRTHREGNKFVSDIDRMREYAFNRGLLQPPTGDGSWWSSRLGYATAAGCYVLTDWRTTKQLGDAWNKLPTDVEGWSPDETAAQARLQREELTAAVPTPAAVAKTLEDLV